MQCNKLNDEFISPVRCQVCSIKFQEAQDPYEGYELGRRIATLTVAQKDRYHGFEVGRAVFAVYFH